MPFLFYWRRDIYAHDVAAGFQFNLNQNSRHFRDAEVGDELFAFTQNTQRKYVFAANFYITAKSENEEGYSYGRYRLWADQDCSRLFDTDKMPACEDVVCSIVPARGSVLGRAFQGPAAVRKINMADALVLRRHLQSAESFVLPTRRQE